MLDDFNVILKTGEASEVEDESHELQAVSKCTKRLSQWSSKLPKWSGSGAKPQSQFLMYQISNFYKILNCMLP